MSKIAPCLWFNGEAEDAARFYVTLVPDSRIDAVTRSPGESPAEKAGEVLLVEFTLAGQRFQALNGGSSEEYGLAVSFSIDCEDQAEVDRIWDAILADGGAEQQCGWIRDRWGVPWQIVPRVLAKIIAGPDRARAARAFAAMMTMVKLDAAAIEAAADGRTFGGSAASAS